MEEEDQLDNMLRNIIQRFPVSTYTSYIQPRLAEFEKMIQEKRSQRHEDVR
jgi:hypothetical protein